MRTIMAMMEKWDFSLIRSNPDFSIGTK